MLSDVEKLTEFIGTSIFRITGKWERYRLKTSAAQPFRLTLVINKALQSHTVLLDTITVSSVRLY